MSYLIVFGKNAPIILTINLEGTINMSDSKSQVEQNNQAAEQAAICPSDCKACKRKGLPILPLRYTVVANKYVFNAFASNIPNSPSIKAISLEGGDAQYVLRTLRMGYVYILLDKKTWDAYEVTEAGHLRQFDAFSPYLIPVTQVEPLSEACLSASHDNAASFINIDTARYNVAQIAFSGDRWTQTVLDEYKSGIRPADRFIEVDLKALTASPESVAQAFTVDSELNSLKQNVLEFSVAEYNATAYQFYGRKERMSGFSGYIGQLSQQYGAPVAALILDDNIGIVQELDAMRANIIYERQVYVESPAIRHKNAISMAIEGYMESLKKGIEANSKARVDVNLVPPQYYDYNPAGYHLAAASSSGNTRVSTSEGDYEIVNVSKEQVSAESYAQARARLLKHYDEAKRADDAKKYKDHIDYFQRRINGVGKDLSKWWQSIFWKKVIIHDYEPDFNPLSQMAQLMMMSKCLACGATDDATLEVWKGWLNEADESKVNNPAYIALFGNHKEILSELMSVDQKGFWIPKGFFVSDDFLNSKYLHQAVENTVFAIIGVSIRLDATASAIKNSAGKLMQAGMEAFSGKKTTMYKAKSTVGVYQDYLTYMPDTQVKIATNETLLSARSKANAQVVNMAGVTDDIVRITDPNILNKEMSFFFWTDATPEQVQKAFRKAGTSTGAAPRTPIDPSKLTGINIIAVSDSNFNSENRQLGAITAGTDEMNNLLRQTSEKYEHLTKNGIGAGFNAFAVGLQVYLMAQNIKEFQKALNTEEEVNALIMLSANTLYLVGSTIEGAGFLKEIVKGKGSGVGLIKAGGVIAGVGAIVEGITYGMKSYKMSKKGDNDAAEWYFAASVFTIAGGVVSVTSALAGSAFFGPAGIALALLVVGTICVLQAINATDTPIEVWLTSCLYGKKKEFIQWGREDSLEDMYLALAEYNAAFWGLSGIIGYNDDMLGLSSEDTVKYQVIFPEYQPDTSAYTLIVSILTPDDKEYPIVFEQYAVPELPKCLPGGCNMEASTQKSTIYPSGLPPAGIRPQSAYKDSNKFIIFGSFKVGNTSVLSRVKLLVDYWPDKTKLDKKMSLNIKEED